MNNFLKEGILKNRMTLLYLTLNYNLTRLLYFLYKDKQPNMGTPNMG